MRSLRDRLRLDWDDIGQAIVQTAARHLADAARARAGAAPDAIAVAQTSPGRIRLSVQAPDLIRRERGDSKTAPEPFLAPTTHDRAALRNLLIDHIRKAIA